MYRGFHCFVRVLLSYAIFLFRFINARRRILQPMLDASNPNANVAKSKKNKPPMSRSQGRYWPQSSSEECLSPSNYEVELEGGHLSPPSYVTTVTSETS